MKELYGSAILFFYFLKWPVAIGVALLYLQGLKENLVLNALWLFCLALILKDLTGVLKR